MSNDDQPVTLSLTSEFTGLLTACRQGQQQGEPFSLVDALAMAALTLAQNGQSLTVEAVMTYAKQHVWPNVEHESQYQGDNTFDSYQSIALRKTEAVIWALQTDDPATNLVHVNDSLPDA